MFPVGITRGDELNTLLLYDNVQLIDCIWCDAKKNKV